MKRLLIPVAALIAGFGLLVPVALAGDPLPQTGRAMLATQGDITIPAGDQADLIVVIDGTATIEGTVTTLVVIDGTANVTGASLQTIVAIRSHVEIGDGTVIYGELQRLDATVHQNGRIEILGGIKDLADTFVAVGAVLAPAFILIWLGFGLAMIVAALLVAGLASRQVRAAERLISEQPGVTGFTGFLGVIVIPVGAIVLFATLIGAPLGAGVLFQVLPMLAFAGYLVGGIWIGDWLLARTGPARERERPYLAAVVGVLVMEVLALVPILGLITVIASLLGFGAVIRLGIQTLRGEPRPRVEVQRPAIAPTGA